MSGCDFILAAILFIAAKKNKVEGRISSLYMILYGIGRFAVEFLRGDPRGSVGALSTSQFISVFIVAAGAVLYYISTKQSKKEESVPLSEK